MVHFSSLIALGIFMETNPCCTGLSEDLGGSFIHSHTNVSLAKKLIYAARFLMCWLLLIAEVFLTSSPRRSGLGNAVQPPRPPLTPWPGSCGEVFSLLSAVGCN